MVWCKKLQKALSESRKDESSILPLETIQDSKSSAMDALHFLSDKGVGDNVFTHIQFLMAFVDTTEVLTSQLHDSIDEISSLKAMADRNKSRETPRNNETGEVDTLRQQLQLANANIKELQEKLEDSELELDREVTNEMSKEIRSLKNQLQKATKSSKDIDELKRQFSKEKDEQESELLRLHAEINEKEEHIELLKALNNE